MPPDSSRERRGAPSHRIPEKSVIFNRLIPVLFIILGIATVLLILFALGVLTGVIRWT
jgi:hypothetical protein